jgi:hypothetical protein
VKIPPFGAIAMPVDYSKYPENWLTEIRPQILMRANYKCEWCGIDHNAVIWRHPHEDCWNLFTYDANEAVRWYGDNYEAYAITVTLTIAHVNDPNPMNCDRENLAALCAACHLRHDAKMHAMNVVRNRNKALEDAGQLRLF